MLWTLKEAAKELRVSAEWLRVSACPRVLLPTSGDRKMPRFVPEECRAWVMAHHTHRKDAA